jgi:mono/diheme cytochrome c family protein
MSPQRRNEPDRSWVVWAVVGAVTLAACVIVVVVVGGGGDDGPADDEAIDAQALYEQHCANCHAIDGAGAVGPALNDGRVVERFPEIDDQIAVITVGRVDLGMPPFGDTLTEEQIQAVAEYTRQL